MARFVHTWKKKPAHTCMLIQRQTWLQGTLHFYTSVGNRIPHFKFKFARFGEVFNIARPFKHTHKTLSAISASFTACECRHAQQEGTDIQGHRREGQWAILFSFNCLNHCPNAICISITHYKYSIHVITFFYESMVLGRARAETESMMHVFI